LFAGKFPGREWRVELPDKMVLRSKAYAIGDRIYALGMAAPGNMTLSQYANRFFDSFKVDK
jgi:hypothetical protein